MDRRTDRRGTWMHMDEEAQMNRQMRHMDKLAYSQTDGEMRPKNGPEECRQGSLGGSVG